MLHLLGRMRAEWSDGRDLLPRGRKARAILAMLVLAAPEPVSRDRMAALLWSAREREQARGSLRQSVHELQEAVSGFGRDVIASDRHHLRLSRANAEGLLEADVWQVASATASLPQGLSRLDDGPLLEDLASLDPAFDLWIAGERVRLAQAAAGVAEAALMVQLARDAPAPHLLALSERLVGIDPLRETGWRGLMIAHARASRIDDAIAAFERCSATLWSRESRPPSETTLALLGEIGMLSRTGPTSPRQCGTMAHPAAGAQGCISQGGAIAARERRRSVRVGIIPLRSTLDQDDPLSVGLAEEITTALARFRWIDLIAPPSLAAIAERTGPVGDSATPHGGDAVAERLRTLGVHFVLDGAIARAAPAGASGPGKVRVTVRLIDVRAGDPGLDATSEIVWAARFDPAPADVLTLQEVIAASIVAQLDPALLISEGRRAAARPPRDAGSYDLLLRAIPAVYRLEESAFREAGDLLAASAAADPEHAAAHAWWAYWHLFLVGQGWAADPAGAMRRAGELAERAVQLDPADARALAVLGHARAYLDRRVDEALVLHAQALALNPNLPLAWLLSGLAHSYAGDHDTALRQIEEARRLSPLDPHACFVDSAETVPRMMRGEYDAVIALGRRAVALNPALSASYKGYLAALGFVGPVQEAVSVRARLLAIEPDFCIRHALERSPLRRARDRDLYAEGLRRAGVPGDRTSPTTADATHGAR